MNDAATSSSLRALGRVVGAIIVASALVLSVWVAILSHRSPRTDDAYVRANVVGIAPHVSGPIVELPIADNQPVKQGDLLFVVDPRPYEAAAARARAELELVEQEIVGLRAAADAADAEVGRREADARYAADHLARVTPLLAKQFVTSDRVDDARRRSRSADAAVRQAQSEATRARALIAQTGELNARREGAQAALRDAELNVGYCRVTAPFDGFVTNLNLAIGAYAREGEPLFALVDGRSWYVLANFRETYLASIEPGMDARVFLVAYPGRSFRGTVQGIGWAVAPGDGTQIGVLPEPKPVVDWVRLARRFQVRIALEPFDAAAPYRMGATASVTVVGGSGRATSGD